jgi:hypothetical protein
MNDCLAFTGELCLLPDGLIDGRTCRVCAALVRWHRKNYTHVLIRESGAAAAVIFPARLNEMRPVDVQACLLQISLADGLAEVRQSVNAVVLASSRTWLWDDEGGPDSYIELIQSKPAEPPSTSDW